MKKYFLTYLFSFLFISVSFGQSTKIDIQGLLVNESDEPLIGGTVVLLQASDSVLKSFGMTNSKGEFILRRVEAGEFILQASFLGFEKYSQPLTVSTSQGNIDIGTIKLKEAETTLDEVKIEGERTPIFFKKDTVEYNADAFATQPNATVEDLLKKLPGVEVEDDGTVKAQGEEVQRVLVDGKEFFGKDPQVATKNLPADVVNRVQVFDRQSDMAEFTGVDDGEREKTINLTLKEDKKKGYFGRASIAGGPRETPEGDLDFDRFEGKFSVNKFTKKLQLSAIGTGNNVNQQGFSVQDYVSFMGGMQGMMRRGGGVRIGGGNSGGLPISNGRSNGFVDTYSGGLNMNYEISKKTKINVSYFYSDITNNTEQDVFSIRSIARQNQAIQRQEEIANSINQNQSGGHNLNLRFDSDIDSFKQVTIRASAGIRDGASLNQSNSSITTIEDELLSESSADNRTSSDRLNFSTQLTYKQKFRKKGRSIVAQLTAGGNDSESLGNIFSTYSPVFGRGDTTAQNQTQLDDQFNYGIKLTYTEPIGKRKYLNLEYSHQNYRYESQKDIYDIEANEEVFNPNLSNHYTNDYFYDRAGLNILFNGEKSQLTIGADLQNSQLRGELLSFNQKISNSYLFVLPSVRWNYQMAQRRRIRFDYSTSINEPSIEQLQPLLDNSIPTNLYIGNPDLDPAYTHRARLNFFSFSQFSFTSIFANITANYVSNQITNRTMRESTGRQITQPINVDNNLRLNAYGSLGFPLRFINWRMNFNANSSYNRGIIFTDIVDNLDEFFTTSGDINFPSAVENISKRWTAGGGLTLENQNKDVIDFSIGARYSYNSTTYSLNAAQNTAWLTQRYFTDVTINFLKSWAISSDFSYRLFGGDIEGQTIALWEASLSRFLGKSKRGQLELVAFDILNQNRGINISSELNIDYQEERINSLSRMFLLRFTFNLSKFGGQAPGGDVRIRRMR